jgi:hypothetical protein
MSVISSNGLYVSASLFAENLLSVKVEASAVAAQEAAAATDPKTFTIDSAFLLVPQGSEKSPCWKRVPLSAAGVTSLDWMSGKRGNGADPVFVLSPLKVDAAIVAKFGVAVGFETSAGTVWGQLPDQNYIP